MPWQYDSQGWLKRQSDFCLNLAALIKYGLMMKPWDSLPSLKKRSGFTERKGKDIYFERIVVNLK